LPMGCTAKLDADAATVALVERPVS
jgi:hypothetical protein